MRYRVSTWDADSQRYTEQIGVPHRHLPSWMLRRALRMLRDRGYTAHRFTRGDADGRYTEDSDPFTLVEQDDYPLVLRDDRAR